MRASKLVKLYKPVQYTYLTPVWSEDDGRFVHTLVPKTLTVTAGRIVYPEMKKTAILYLAALFNIPPIVLAEELKNDFLVVNRNGCSHLTTVDDVDDVFCSPVPNSSEYKAVYFDKRRSYGWLVWARSAFGILKIKVTDDVDFQQESLSVWVEHGDKYISECDYISLKTASFEMEHLQQVPYVSQKIRAHLNDLLLPTNWIPFNYGMAIIMDFWLKYLRQHGHPEETLYSTAWEITLHGIVLE